jgi:hypothetical protein
MDQTFTIISIRKMLINPWNLGVLVRQTLFRRWRLDGFMILLWGLVDGHMDGYEHVETHGTWNIYQPWSHCAWYLMCLIHHHQPSSTLMRVRPNLNWPQGSLLLVAAMYCAQLWLNEITFLYNIHWGNQTWQWKIIQFWIDLCDLPHKRIENCHRLDNMQLTLWVKWWVKCYEVKVCQFIIFTRGSRK